MSRSTRGEGLVLTVEKKSTLLPFSYENATSPCTGEAKKEMQKCIET